MPNEGTPTTEYIANAHNFIGLESLEGDEQALGEEIGTLLAYSCWRSDKPFPAEFLDNETPMFSDDAADPTHPRQS